MSSILSLFIWLILFASAGYGWKAGGWPGLVLGGVAGFPIAGVLIGLLALLAGLIEWAIVPPPGDERSFFARKSGMGKLMIVAAVGAVWLGTGLAMVRSSRSQKQRETAVLVAILVPLGIVTHVKIDRWIESRGNRPRV